MLRHGAILSVPQRLVRVALPALLSALLVAPLAEETTAGPVGDAPPGGPVQALLEPYGVDHLPGFSLPVLGGGEAHLSDQAGRVVLVHFFATWCEPCREELPALARLAAAHPGELVVIAIDVGEVDLRVRRFFEALPVPFAVALDRDGAVTRQWDIHALPSTVILDRRLHPRWRATGDVAWDEPAARSVIADLLAQTAHPAAGAPASGGISASGGVVQ